MVGCGRVGSELATRLTAEGHTAAIIDKDPRAFVRLPEHWPGQRIVGFGFDRDCLVEAKVHDADALAAVTSGDNSNILTARIARETFDIQNVVARIYDPRRAVIYQRLGIPTVATVTWTTDQAMRRLFPDSATTEWTDPSGDVMLVEMAVSEQFAGRRYTSLNKDHESTVVTYTRGNQTRLVNDDAIAQEGDVMRIAVIRHRLDDLTQRVKNPGAAS